MNNNIKGKKGESFVNEIANKTFLDYWCFPNPYDEKGNKKEICDLLILFKDICIICQIKNYELKNNYERYFRKTVQNGIKQIEGAERKLFQLNNEIYIKNQKQGLIKFDKNKYSKIIRLIIHLGEGLTHQSIGQLSKSNMEFIHIFDKKGIEHLLQEINTISDFVDYLKARESLVMKIEKTALYGQEKDLLGFYLQIRPRFSEFVNDNKEKWLLIDLEDSWNEYENKKKSEQNEDILLKIENLIYDWVKNDLIKSKNNQVFTERLMSLNREERRVFATSFIGFIHPYTKKGYNRIIRRNSIINQIGFIFFYYPEKYKTKEVQQLMSLSAEGYALFNNFEFKDYIVIGVSEHENFKLLHMNVQKGDEKDIDELKMLLNHLGWFKKENLQVSEIDFNKKQ